MTSQKSPQKAPRLIQLYTCVLVLILMPALTFAWETTVNKVHDGDTFEVTWKAGKINGFVVSVVIISN